MQLRWLEGNDARSALWRSETGAPPPVDLVVGNDELTADEAHRLARTKISVLWRGDFQNARQLLAALGRRVDRSRKKVTAATSAEGFHLYRQERSHVARLLSRLLVPLDAGHVVPLRRAPDVREALTAAYGPVEEPAVMSLRELLGVISAHEWQRKGVEVPSLGARLHPRFGVFAPVRGEYVDLVAEAPLPATDGAFDIGTGTGVLAAVLLNRGVERVVATDQDERALGCARGNLARLGFADRVDLARADLFPPGRASLVVCNPPWLPGKPRSPIEHAIYDPGGRMLRGFLDRLGKHLAPGGEGWLVLSDLAEHLGLRTRQELLDSFAAAGLVVAGKSDTSPTHPRVNDPDDPLHAARRAEVTSLWRLVAR